MKKWMLDTYSHVYFLGEPTDEAHEIENKIYEITEVLE